MIVNEVAKNVEKIISIDTAKNSFQVLVVNQKTGKKKNTKVQRSKFVEYILKQGPCLIFMESCSASQHWARLFEGHGFTVKLIAAQHVKILYPILSCIRQLFSIKAKRTRAFSYKVITKLIQGMELWEFMEYFCNYWFDEDNRNL